MNQPAGCPASPARTAIDPEREEAREGDGEPRVHAVAGSGHGASQIAEHGGAAAAYESVVMCEPLHEAAHRGLLLTLTRAGRRGQALRHFDRLSALLRDLELEPDHETLELYERIRAADIVPRSRDVAARSE